MKNKTILLVEDESIIALAEAQKIRSFGYDVINAYNGEEAVKVATSGKDIDLILMDIGLNEGIDGTVAARQIFEKKDIPIAFLTAHIEREYVSRVKEISRYGYILKNSGDYVLKSSIEMVFELIESHYRVKESEKRFRTIFEQVPLGVALIDSLKGHIYELNSKFTEIVCRNKQEMKKINWMSIIHYEDIQSVLDKMILLRSGKINGFNMQKRYIRPNGWVVWVDMTITPLLEDNDKSIKHLCMIEDITEQRQTEIQLKERTELLNNHVKELKCLYGISSLLEIPGASLDDILQGVVDLIPSACRYTDNTCARIKFTNRYFYSKDFEESKCSITDYIFFKKKKVGQIDLYIISNHLNHGKEEYFFLSEEQNLLSIIAERISAIAERFFLKRKLLDISEKEHIKIGQDLHDGVGQDLTGIGYLFGALADKLAKNKIPEKSEVTKIMNLIDETKKHIRRISLGLSPVNTKSDGIINAVKELCVKAKNIYNVFCKFDYDLLDIEDNVKATHIFYIIQEALTNAVKHGKATDVLISLMKENDYVRIIVQDNGIGLQYKTASQNGFGIELMKYRSDIIGGEISFAENKPVGTIVTCLVKSDNLREKQDSIYIEDLDK